MYIDTDPFGTNSRLKLFAQPTYLRKNEAPLPSETRPTLAGELNKLVDILENLDLIAGQTEIALGSEHRHADLGEEQFCNCQREALLMELAFTTQSVAHLRSVITAYNQLFAGGEGE